MNLTKAEAIENHRKMWWWIAEETERLKRKVTKEEYFKEMKVDDIPREECYCCEHATSLRHLIICDHCPIKWPDESGCATVDDTGLYDCWYYTDDYHESAELARQIAELPEREGV